MEICNLNNLNKILMEVFNAYDKYKDDYFILKTQCEIMSADRIIWCSGWTEPYHPDYITEINDNTVNERKILKKIPTKKQYVSEHYFIGNNLVKSLLWGEIDNLVSEKFFVYSDSKCVAAEYAVFNMDNIYLREVCIIKYDKLGNVIEYSEGKRTDELTLRNGKIYTYDGERYTLGAKLSEHPYWNIKSRMYTYVDGHIVKATAIDNFTSCKDIILFDNPLYKNVSGVLDTNLPKMNPCNYADFDFIYGESGYCKRYVRTNYSYGKKHINEFNMRKGLMKKYDDYEINCFKKVLV